MAGFFNSIQRNFGGTVKAHFKEYADCKRKLSSMIARKEFLVRCRRNGVFPAHLQNSFNCLFELLEERSPFLNKLQRCVERFKKSILNLEIKHTFHKIKRLRNEQTRLEATIKGVVPETVWESFTETQNSYYERSLADSRRSTGQKYQRLLQRSIENNTEKLPSLNEKALLNAPQVTLPPEVEVLLSLGPKFALPHNNLAEAPIYHLIADTETVIKSNKDLEVQGRARCMVANNIQNYIHTMKNNPQKTPQQTFFKEAEIKTKLFLKQHPELLVLKADKGNRTVILPREEYIAKMKQLLDNPHTYKRVPRDPTSGFESDNNDIVKRMTTLNLIDEKEARQLTTRKSVCPKIYGQPKAHKAGLPMRPVVPCMTAPSYALSKYLCRILQNAMTSKYNIRSSFEFCQYANALTLPPNHVMVSFDVVALFTSIPKNLVISSIKSRWAEIQPHTEICKSLFCEFVEFCIDCSYFSFNGEYYVQQFGTAMGNPVSPVVSDWVTECLLDRAIESLDFPVEIIRKYVDDLFLALPANKIDYVQGIFNQQNEHIQFTVEVEQNCRLPFLDMTLIRREDQTIRTEWYIKPIASGRFLNFHSCHPLHHKMNVAFNFANRVKTLSTNIDLSEIKNTVRKHLAANDYPRSLISRVLNRLGQTQQIPEQEGATTTTTQQETVTAMEESGNEVTTKTFYSLTNIVGLTQQITKTLQKEYPTVHIATKNTKTVNTLLPLVKDKTPIQEQSNVIYSIPCSDCDACYIGLTTTKLKQRMSGHKTDIKRIQTLRQQGYTNTDPQISWAKEKSALVQHATAMEHSIGIDSVKIVDRSMKSSNLPILESCHIKNTDKTVNKRTDTDNLHAAYAGILHEIKNIKTKRNANQNKPNKNNTNSRDNTHTNT